MKYKGLILYKRSQTFTNTVYDHLISIGKKKGLYQFDIKYLDIDLFKPNKFINNFNFIIIHYSIRLCFSQIPLDIENLLRDFKGVKALFIQDEYDNTYNAWEKILKINFNIVFTCVPEKHIKNIYPPKYFKGIEFINVLTGYCKEISLKEFNELPRANERKIIIGYRGRDLNLRYGKLGFQKKEMALKLDKYCKENNFISDIKYKSSDRIYGVAWKNFLTKCRATLGNESGCNIFDWEGDLDEKLNNLKFASGYKKNISERNFLSGLEKDNLMNQISPKIFESINTRTALVLIEGSYSNILEKYKHYLPLKKDFSNLNEVFSYLNDIDFIDNLTKNAFYDICLSGNYSYEKFSNDILKIIFKKVKENKNNFMNLNLKESKFITTIPMKPVIIPNSYFYNLLKFFEKLVIKIPKTKLKKFLIKSIKIFLRKFNII